MGSEISRRTKAELIAVVRRRYREASKREKSRILDEFVAVVDATASTRCGS